MGLVKRGTTWWMSFIYQGRQVRKSSGTADKRMAEAILSKVRVQIVEGKYFDKPKEEVRSFREFMDRYLREHASRRSRYGRHVGIVRNLSAHFGNPRLDHITPKAIVGYKNKRYADGVTPATINRELALLKKAFNLACREWEWAKDNPVCRVSMERENNTRDRWLTCEEERRLLAASAPWLQEVIVFAIHTGMRCGEMLNLTWAGVDLNRRTVTVFKSKNGERRTIPLSHTLVEMLQNKASTRLTDSGLVFTSVVSTPLDAANLRRSFRLALKHGQVSDFRFHDLRHTSATRMVQAGVDLYKVQRILGHKSPMMTQRYAHHYPESLRDGVAIFDAGRTFSTNLAQSGIRPEQASLTC